MHSTLHRETVVSGEQLRYLPLQLPGNGPQLPVGMTVMQQDHHIKQMMSNIILY